MTQLRKRARNRFGTANSPTILVVGRDVARGVAKRFDDSAAVRFATADEDVARQARDAGLSAHLLDVTSAGALRPVADAVDLAVVAERVDRRTLLIAQLLRSCCAVDRVVAVLTDDTYRDAFEETGIDLVTLDAVVGGAIDERVSQLSGAG